ncbi:MAG: hypothetical protein RIS18_958 [Actinomycetota bacterium]
MYLNSSANIAKADDEIFSGTKYRYETIYDSKNYTSEVLSYIKSDIQSNNFNSAVLFCPWLPQFSREDLEKLSGVNNPIKISIAGITMRKQSSTWRIEDYDELFTHQKLFNSDPFKLLWIGEPVPFQLKTNKKIRFLPEYAETKIKSNLPKTYDLSFHGQLASYRGLFEILVIALFNPKLRINIRGYSFSAHRIWRPVKYRIFQYTSWRQNLILSIFFSLFSLPISLFRYLPNVKFSSVPFHNESDLDDALSATKAIFFCTKLPFGSGLMTKSLSAGIPVIWNGLPGQASEFLKLNYEAGQFKYWNIFVPGHFSRKLARITPPAPLHDKMWSRVMAEISELKKFI